MKTFVNSTRRQEEQGFTIVELMIATLVFSVILTVITVGVISFTNRYYKGVNSSTTQNTAQSIADTIDQAIQFGSSDITPTTGATDYFCAGGYAFTYKNAGARYDGSSPGGLYMAPMNGTCSAVTTGGKQLLSKNMRLTELSVTPFSGEKLYKVSVGVAFGEDDQFCSPTITPGKCGTTSNLAAFWGVGDIQCRTGAGSQYCATSKLTTVVDRRLNVGT